MEDWRPPPPGIVPCGALGKALTDVFAAAATTMPIAPEASTRGSQGWNSSSDDDGVYVGTNSSSHCQSTPLRAQQQQSSAATTSGPENIDDPRR